MNGKLTMPKTASYELGLTVAGRAKLWVNGELVIDNWTRQRPGEFFYGQGTVEEKGMIALTAGVPADIYVEYTNTKPPEGPEADRSQPALMRGVRLGGAEKIDPEGAIEEAIKIAAASDAVIIVAGLTPEWESEGFDRPSLDLPGRQSELISRVSSANPKTIVCLQAGSAVSMPWVERVSGIIQAWYSGNSVGEALADVIFGKVNPSGRLALSFPAREQDNPAYMNTRSENGKIHYREDLFVGYKWYQARGIPPLFPFGFGLSYTTFSFSNISITKPSSRDAASFSLSVEVTITNEGPTTGSEVVQVYITLPDIGVTTPKIQLRGFSKAKDIDSGKSKVVIVRMDKYAVSYWDTARNVWRAKVGKYDVLVGKSSQDIVFKGEFNLEEDFEWSGL
ncbi:hypothetical protein NLI96_g8280 [Meripilus lineatus]|uniref:beta-glucosidase n=1 Tax=Meripilus lineatus TaxID=2056292 RepID=A0AAD5UZH4_9APHY|nr:hypothetical protein NLI96_g8280 [Physisporinus lineatus]